jgi:predicted DNA-binding transcriptional regulator YafY
MSGFGRAHPASEAKTMLLRHSYSFFNKLADNGRPDLAAVNAAVDGRFRLSILYSKRAGLSARQAWYLAWRQYRAESR